MPFTPKLRPLYKSIVTKLLHADSVAEFTEEGLKPIEVVDFYAGHYQNVKTYPTALVDLNDIDWKTKGKGQTGSALIRIHVVHELYQGMESNNPDQDDALKILDQVELVSAILHEWDAEGTGPLTLTKTALHERAADWGTIHVLEFSTYMQQKNIGRRRKLVQTTEARTADITGEIGT